MLLREILNNPRSQGSVLIPELIESKMCCSNHGMYVSTPYFAIIWIAFMILYMPTKFVVDPKVSGPCTIYTAVI